MTFDFTHGKCFSIHNHTMDSTALKNCPSNQPIIVLAHNPKAVSLVTGFANSINYTVDLIISGRILTRLKTTIKPILISLGPFNISLYISISLIIMPI